jgi:TolB-like protein
VVKALSLFNELKRRNVFRVAIAYVVVAWLVAQVLQLVFESFVAPDWVMKAVLVLLAVGLIFAVFFAWAFELTPEGLRKEKEVNRGHSITGQTGRKLDRMIIAFLVLILAWFLLDEFYLETRQQAAPAGQLESVVPAAAVPESEGQSVARQNMVRKSTAQSVAVLPFRAMSSGADDEYFADGLTEEILNYLAGLPELLVTARTSAFFFKDQDLPIPEIAARLGVANVVEGSVRRSGDQVRVTAQLIRAEDGFHLWSQTYDRTLENIFSVQEDIAANIAAKLDVVLSEDKLERMRRSGIGDVDAFIAYQKGMDLFGKAHETDNPLPILVEANRFFDLALERVPDIGNALYLRTDLFGHILFAHAGKWSSYEQSELDDALAEIRSSLGRAIRAADNEPLRAILETELQLFSEDWRGILSRLDRAFETGFCNPHNWMTAVAVPFGWADRVNIQQQENRQCDPLSSVTLLSSITGLSWGGQAEEALALVEGWITRNGYEAWADDMRYTLLYATGKWAEDPGFFSPPPPDSTWQVPRTIFGLAWVGRIDEARTTFEEFERNNLVDLQSRILVGAVLGDRAMANAAAAEVDGRPGGTLLLLMTVDVCLCGAPFDLEATPTFKARVEQAGMSWPPLSPLNPPAKDW